MSDPQPLLSVERLSIIYQGDRGRVSAVDNVSFDLAAGEILALIGESGAGKSAVAQAIPGLLPASARVSGSLRLNGRQLLSLGRAGRTALRGREVAMVFQDPAAGLDPVFTIGSQLDEALAAAQPALRRAQRRQQALMLLEQVSIPDAQQRLQHYPHQFSGGQLQRIMIAIALAGRPAVLIADEPTTALDVTTQREILDLLHRLNRRYRMAILLITHDLGVVADIAQRVVVLRAGRVVETQPVDALFAAPEQPYTRQLLAAQPGSDGPDARAALTDAVPLLEVRDLTIAWREGFGRRREVVHGVSFSLHKGEFLGLLGESGSGKTTIGRTLLGTATAESGSIRFNGEPLTGRRSDPRDRIGAVFQNPLSSLNPRLTLAQSIAEPLTTHRSLSAREVAQRVATLLDQVGLPAGWQQRYPHEISGGQCQRVAIARALALKPQLLIADEPTSALDVSIQQSILQLLRDLRDEYHFACLFISHDLGVINSLCHSVMVLKQGRIVEQGSTRTIFSQPQHDYTRSLIASIPRPDPAYQRGRRAEREQQ